MGTAIANNTVGIFSHDKAATDLQSLWRAFCLRQCGEDFHGIPEHKKIITACKGHTHVEGKAVFFAQEKILAQPLWIYWAGNRNNPSDVLIHFYQSNSVKTLNQFDLKALCDSKNEVSDISAIFKVGDEEQNLYVFRTTIGSNNTITTQPMFA